MAEQGVKGPSGYLRPALKVEVHVAVLDIGETLVPALALDPVDLALFGGLDGLSSSVGERLVGREFRQGAVHGAHQQLIAQAGRMTGAALLCHPV